MAQPWLSIPPPGARSASAPWGVLVAGCALGALAALLLFAPARWLGGLIDDASQGHVQMRDAQGTLWDGSAQLMLTGGRDSTDASTLPGRLRWQLRPGWAQWTLQVRADCCTAQAWHIAMAPHWGGAQWTLANQQSAWPAQWLSGLGTPWNTIRLQGQLLLRSEAVALQYSLGRWQVDGRLTLDALDMASRLSTLRPMGSYRLQVQGGSVPQVDLQTLQGSLQLRGRGQWTGGKLRFEGEAQASPERQEALANLLNIIGQRMGARSLIKLG
ncbi:MAG: type II secretion system protein N [Betaproteobacteria bacterium]|nr:type II secretion system protein N [Betaproteobacteria bacterium]